jgi:hypothetical protein
MSYVHGHPAAHGDNKQYLFVWDMNPEGGGEPQKLMLPAIDAKEWHHRDPGRYSLHEPVAAA